MGARENFVKNNAEKARSMQSATEFINLGASSIRLSGWSSEALCELIASGSKHPLEAVILEKSSSLERKVGDIVTRTTVFPSSDDVLWEGDSIAFRTEAGLVVNIDEYTYVQSHGLNGNQFFAETKTKDGDPLAVWKKDLRRTQQARRDKSKEILNLTVGTLTWTPTDANIKGNITAVKSPLLMCCVKEAASNGRELRFSITSTTLKVNSIMAREIKKQFHIELFEGCPSEFGFDSFGEVIRKIRENVEQVFGLVLNSNDLHLCLLDSSKETICQSIERNLDAIVKSELVGVFSGEDEYQPRQSAQNATIITPLPADDSQRSVILRVLNGNSVNVHAGPGTGKSQTVVNCAANILAQGKSFCMMAEKAAANEVFINYVNQAGIAKYCLTVKENTSVKDVIGCIKHCIAAPISYVDAEAAKALIETYHDAEKEILKLNCVYEPIPEAKTDLYHIIGEAIQTDDLSCGQYICVQPRKYQTARIKLNELQSQLINTMSESEWVSYLNRGTSGDEEQDEMLDDAFDELKKLGIDLKACVVEKAIAKPEIRDTVVSQLARLTAEELIEKYGIGKYGNRRLKTLYKKLLDSSAAMCKISRAFLLQTLSMRTAEAAKNSKFVELLDRLATSKMNISDLFKQYGREILKLCPILVTTPNALVNFDSLNDFDVLAIDESSQMPLINVLPFLRGNRQLVVFGDPMQLDITTFYTKTEVYEQREDEEFDLSQTDKSILHVVQGKLPSCQLEYHYRSKTERLLTVSNSACYDGMLNIAPDIYKTVDNLPDWLGYEVIRIDNPELNAQGGNQTEAEAIVERIITLRKAYPQKSMGIIALNERQQNAIWDAIDSRIELDFGLSDILSLDDDAIWLRTLENSQGKEADIVFISIGHSQRNSDGKIRKGISDINNAGGLNRLNVLFTRAREKIIITISFDYRELKDSDNPGVLRLYDYLHYAVTSEGQRHNLADTHTDRYNKALTDKMRMLYPECDVVGRIGYDQMTVDIGIGHKTNGCYETGILFPNRAQTPNSISTKVNVLERAGWNVLPLSPISFFTKRETFVTQLTESLQSTIKFSLPPDSDFITETKPSILFKLEDFAPSEVLRNALTEQELISVDFAAAYAGIWSQKIVAASQRKLSKLAESGDWEARLKRIIDNLAAFITGGKKTELFTAVQKIYQYEKRGCYLYAQLLREKADADDSALIDELLSEAVNAGIKIS